MRDPNPSLPVPPEIPTGGVLCAVSGGPDSIALAVCLAHLANCRPLHLAWINHGLQPALARRERAAVKGLASHLQVPLHQADLPALPRWREGDPVPEARVRSHRYRLLGELAEQLELDNVATAHHRDDLFESQLLAMLRGGDLRGLRGMIPLRPLTNRCRLWRPLLGFDRAHVHRWLEQYPGEPVQDPSNLDVRMRRNRLRRQVIPHLQQHGDPLLRRHHRLAQLAQHAVQAIEFTLDAWLTEHALPNMRRNCCLLPLAAMRSLQPALLFHCLERIRVLLERPPQNLQGRRRHAALNAWLQHSRPGKFPLEEMVLEKSGLWLTIVSSQTPKVPAGWSLELGQPRLADARWHWSWASAPITGPSTWSGGPWNHRAVRIRQRRSGDKIHIPRRGTRSVKQLFHDFKVPRAEREVWPVIADADRVLAVPGLAVGTAAADSLDPAARRWLCIDAMPNLAQRLSWLKPPT